MHGYTLDLVAWTFHCKSAVTALAFLSTIDVVIGYVLYLKPAFIRARN